MTEFYPEGWLTENKENKAAIQNITSLMDACRDKKILEARATICDGSHNLIVDLGCVKGIIPREEGAIGIKEGLVRDIAIISRVNRPVCFIVQSLTKDERGNPLAILSRKAAQIICKKEYINNLVSGDVVKARITHLEPFGVFADIGCGVISLLPIDTISVSRIDHPKERFLIDMDIRAIVKSNENGRISLTHKELLGTWEENASFFSVGETVAGIIRSVEDYGAFVELSPNLAGLAEIKEGVKKGQQTSVYIKNIIPERMKIKLIIIDTFNYDYKPSVPIYFYKEDHINRFIYSPKDSAKLVETVFENIEAKIK
ncbi:MAG: S1 RNA-binding domain-containing protein [Oscillospiraceae bacterium]|jgi:small subunit ribosomal protein S1|nr:S1 RNA-binding domain-containing protein [Oscillospiraceae bacterium]